LVDSVLGLVVSFAEESVRVNEKKKRKKVISIGLIKRVMIL
jgi:hypothetical protein